MRQLVLIAAVARNGVIGINGDLPWRLPDDLRHFRRLTTGNTVLMGRRTWASLGKPLPDRDNWVLSRDAGFDAAGARVFARLDDALDSEHRGELIVIGGADLYRQTLSRATRLELTEVDAEVSGDTYFPAFDRSLWRESARQDHAADERHARAFSFVTLLRA